MLILSRRTGEKLLVGDATITILKIANGRGRVAIGIEAPRETRIVRKELEDRDMDREEAEVV